MTNLLKISDAASMALHGVILLADESDRMLSTKEIATRLQVSEAHMSKVLQRLSKAKFVRSVRGPRGGFFLEKDAADVTLLDVYESIDGPLGMKNCLLETPICQGDACIFGELIKKTNQRVREYLSGTTVAELTQGAGSEKE